MPKDKGNFFVHRPIVAIVIAILIVIIGSVSMIGLPIEQYPNLTPPIVQVRASYMGADAISVEESVATPLEQLINLFETRVSIISGGEGWSIHSQS